MKRSALAMLFSAIVSLPHTGIYAQQVSQSLETQESAWQTNLRLSEQFVSRFAVIPDVLSQEFGFEDQFAHADVGYFLNSKYIGSEGNVRIQTIELSTVNDMFDPMFLVLGTSYPHVKYNIDVWKESLQNSLPLTMHIVMDFQSLEGTCLFFLG